MARSPLALEADRRLREQLEKESRNFLLLMTLDLAVPLRILEMRDWTPERRIASARGIAQIIAEKGDVLQFGGKKKGEAASTFNALAQGLAVGAYQPGGVRFGGRHWEVEGESEGVGGQGDPFLATMAAGDDPFFAALAAMDEEDRRGRGGRR